MTWKKMDTKISHVLSYSGIQGDHYAVKYRVNKKEHLFLLN